MKNLILNWDSAVITRFSLAVIPPPAGAPVPERLTQRAAVAAWKAEIEKAASTGKFSGVWLWAKNGKTITSGARGKADRETGIDNTLNTRLRIGSIEQNVTRARRSVGRNVANFRSTIRSARSGPIIRTPMCVQGKGPAPVVAHGRHGDIFRSEFEAQPRVERVVDSCLAIRLAPGARLIVFAVFWPTTTPLRTSRWKRLFRFRLSTPRRRPLGEPLGTGAPAGGGITARLNLVITAESQFSIRFFISSHRPEHSPQFRENGENVTLGDVDLSAIWVDAALR